MPGESVPNPGAGYREIAGFLRSDIESGKFQPGSKIPGENELMARFGVEQPTARRALEVLKNEGLIYAKRGSGTYVREFRPIRRVSPDRFKTTVWGTGRSIWSEDVDRRPVVDDVQVSQEAAPEHIANVLELDGDPQVLVRRRRFLVDGRPVQLATSYYPTEIVAGSRITEKNTGDGGSYARLKELGYEPVHFREELRARMPVADEAKSLGLTQGVPIVMVVRTAYTKNDQPVEVNEMVLDASSYIFEYKFTS